ncbi:hypothetical protein BW687_026425, partial [Pseudomonas graminis]|uniref:hypothetical protein n=1 Tax=Pseudomonas graminis TaxID=158627 RepID=UPI002349EDD7
LTNAVGQATLMAQADRFREQARSHNGSALPRISASCTKLHSSECKTQGKHKTCGSQLADEWVAQTKLMAEADRLRELAHPYRRCVLPRDFSVMHKTAFQ